MNRNVTLSLPDELVKKAKVLAAQRDTSISAIVTSLLSQEIGEVEDYDRAWEAEETMMDVGVLQVGPISWARSDLHRR